MIYERDNNEYKETSRYQVLRVINIFVNRYLETYNDLKIPESDNDRYHVVKNKEVGRLDMIANEYYNDPSLWWAIALANGFIDPFIVNEGDLIRIPSRVTLFDPNVGILSRKGR